MDPKIGTFVEKMVTKKSPNFWPLTVDNLLFVLVHLTMANFLKL